MCSRQAANRAFSCATAVYITSLHLLLVAIFCFTLGIISPSANITWWRTVDDLSRYDRLLILRNTPNNTNVTIAVLISHLSRQVDHYMRENWHCKLDTIVTSYFSVKLLINHMFVIRLKNGIDFSSVDNFYRQ